MADSSFKRHWCRLNGKLRFETKKTKQHKTKIVLKTTGFDDVERFCFQFVVCEKKLNNKKCKYYQQLTFKFK